jgi:hypothetical protein
MESRPARIVTPVTWAFAPEWLTVGQACTLSGHTPDVMRHIVAIGGVDTSDVGLIEKASLWEFQEALALVLHWQD